MPQEELRQSLYKLREEIEALGDRDPSAQARLSDLLAELEHTLEHPGDESSQQTLVDDVKAAIEQFEMTHPTATSVLNHIMLTLGNMGI